MLYRILADIVLIFHMIFILFAVFGGLLILCRKWVLYIHIPAAVWGILVELMHWTCPLTSSENYLRKMAGDSGYSGDFIEHYLLAIIYPQGLTPQIQLVLGLLVLTANFIIYSLVISKFRKLNIENRE
ncbi:putative membrane protein [hydrothermal vent metagenome]|uniref:Putative membrane protein n=1 Tax=hydrothermal vent metagenome TaxID=652676 RepID=A0A3B0YCZ2_9ZZZZ